MQIKINNLTKKYKDLIAVNNVSLNIKSNEIFALLGVNGAGKTTTIKMLTGLETKDSGEIYFNGYSVDKDLEVIKKHINISPQETAIAENLSVQENIEFIAQIYGVNKIDCCSKVEEILKIFNLLDVKNKKAKLLSGGMQRKLSIAMAIVTDPKVLFLDEPTLGLDVLSRKDLWKLIENLKEKMTIILTTHYMEEAEQLADNVAIMNKGEVIDVDTPSQLLLKTKSKNLEEAFIKIVEGL